MHKALRVRAASESASFWAPRSYGGLGGLNLITIVVTQVARETQELFLGSSSMSAHARDRLRVEMELDPEVLRREEGRAADALPSPPATQVPPHMALNIDCV